MSIRAIAGLLGVGTVHREMVSLTGVPDGTPDREDYPPVKASRIAAGTVPYTR